MKIITSIILFALTAANITYAKQTVTFDIVLNPMPDKITTITPLVELAAMYPGSVKLNIGYKDVSYLKANKRIAEELGLFVYLNETNIKKFRELVECVDYDPTLTVCIDNLGDTYKAYLKVKEEYGQKVLATFEANSKKEIPDGSLPEVRIEGNKYKGAMGYNELVAEINTRLPWHSKIIALKKPETTKIYYLATERTITTRNLGREFFIQRTSPNIEFVTVFPNTEEGQDLIKKSQHVQAPAYIAKPQSKKSSFVSGLINKSKAEKTESGYYTLKIDNFKQLEFVDGEPQPKSLTVYVMSHCPHGVKAVESIIQAQRAGKIDKDIKLDFKYIVSKNPDGSWRSMRGEEELAENIRQLTIAKHYPNKYHDYMLLRAKDYESDWKPFAKKLGIDIETVEANLADGERQLAIDFVEVDRRSVNASPTVVWENQKILKTGEHSRLALGYDIFKRK